MQRKAIAMVGATLLCTTTATTAWAWGDEDRDRWESERVVLHDVDGDRVGVVWLRQKGDVVHVRARLHSLEPGFHGFHIHQTGECDPDATTGPFTTAGGHYAGADTTHGHHAGDMPSLLVTEMGRAWLGFATDRFELAELRDADGSAVIVHADPDNFANIPDRYTVDGVRGPDAMTLATGDAGSRVACGVID
jgi:Cu-Zn family superoxide dismutase